MNFTKLIRTTQPAVSLVLAGILHFALASTLRALESKPGLTAAPVSQPTASPVGAENESPAPRRSGRLNPAAPPRLGEPINDKAVARFLEVEGEKLVRAGQMLTNWQSQLDRK